jgi:hypothetical protein
MRRIGKRSALVIVFLLCSVVNLRAAVTLMWDTYVQGSTIANYINVFRQAGSTCDGPFDVLATIPITQPTYDDTTAVYGNTYCWKLNADTNNILAPDPNAGETSADSNRVVAVAEAADPVVTTLTTSTTQTSCVGIYQMAAGTSVRTVTLPQASTLPLGRTCQYVLVSGAGMIVVPYSGDTLNGVSGATPTFTASELGVSVTVESTTNWRVLTAVENP